MIPANPVFGCFFVAKWQWSTLFELNYTTVDPKQFHQSHMKMTSGARQVSRKTQFPCKPWNQKLQESNNQFTFETSWKQDQTEAGKQDGRQNKTRPQTSPARQTQHPSQGAAKVKDKATWERNGEAKLGHKARWETRPETSPARRTQHPSQGERQSQMGNKWGNKTGRQSQIKETRPETSPARRTQHPSQGERQSQMGGETNWETSPARRTQHPSQGERQSQVGNKLGDKPSEADTAPQGERQSQMGNKWRGKTERQPDGRQIGRQDRRQAQRGGRSTPARVKDKARWETNGERKLEDKARWETNWRQAQRGGHSTPAKVKDKARWKTNWETSPARRTQHHSQGERQSTQPRWKTKPDGMGGKLGDKPTEADTAPQPCERRSQMGDKLGDKLSEADAAPQPRWKTKPDGRQIGRQDQRQA